MTARMALANIAAFGLQVTVLVAAGAALARAFRIDEPRAALAYWRTLLLVCLALPFCQPWNIVIPPALVSMTTLAPATVASAIAVAPLTLRPAAWPVRDIVLIALAAGILARALWLTMGACALHRLRRDASPLEPLPASVQRAQERTGARAGMFVSDRISGPITFGLFRPVVVFPPSVSAMASHIQEAIACHELLHVRRRDWLSEVFEEVVRTVLWFHPAIWWLIGRIRLTREQVVDRAVIHLTESKEHYVEALLAVATVSSPTLTPASPFLRRHLLKKRVARILQETTMTTRRVITSLTASAAALALAATFAVRSFPLEAQGWATADNGEPIQLVKGGEHLLHGQPPGYPRRAIEQKVEGEVVVEMTLDERGEVSDARVVSGPEELRKATLEAVLQWHYSPSAIRSTVTQATLRFHLPPAGLEKAELEKVVFAEGRGEGELRAWAWKVGPAVTPDEQRVELSANYMKMTADHVRIDGKVPLEMELKIKHELSGDGALKFYEAWTPEMPTFRGTPRLVDVRTERVPEAIAKELLAQAGVAVGDSITQEAARRIQEVAQAMDEHFRVEFESDGKGGIVLTILTR